MTILEDDLRAALHDQADALSVPDRPALERDVVARRNRRGSRWLFAAACLVLVVAVAGGALVSSRDAKSSKVVVGGGSDTTAPARAVNGWLATASGRDIVLRRTGAHARRLAITASQAGDVSCPTWSPDATHLAFPRFVSASGSSGNPSSKTELVVVPIRANLTTGTPSVISLEGFPVLRDRDPRPCALWSPDGRWLALAGGAALWLVDAQTGEIRQLPNLRPSDLEWRPGTDQLAMAGDLLQDAAGSVATPVTVYDVATGELRQLGSVRAATITWSPDGSTLAYQGGDSDTDELRLVDADGTHERVLTHMGRANHGIGAVWSPSGERIAYQRLVGRSGERHEVVLVDVADGHETVITPPTTAGPEGPLWWYPFAVSWSPDGRTLLYSAWNLDKNSRQTMPSGTLAVSADAPTRATVLEQFPLGGQGRPSAAPEARTQAWGREPG
jgi:Tol biopolymer transport system component